MSRLCAAYSSADQTSGCGRSRSSGPASAAERAHAHRGPRDRNSCSSAVSSYWAPSKPHAPHRSCSISERYDTRCRRPGSTAPPNAGGRIRSRMSRSVDLDHPGEFHHTAVGAVGYGVTIGNPLLGASRYSESGGRADVAFGVQRVECDLTGGRAASALVRVMVRSGDPPNGLRPQEILSAREASPNRQQIIFTGGLLDAELEPSSKTLLFVSFRLSMKVSAFHDRSDGMWGPHCRVE